MLAVFGALFIILMNMLGGVVFARLVSVQALVRFSEHAVLTNFNGVKYFEFKVFGQWQKEPMVNMTVKAHARVQTTVVISQKSNSNDKRIKVDESERNETTQTRESWIELKMRCPKFPMSTLPVTCLHCIDESSPFHRLEHEKGFEVLEVLVLIGGHDKALGRDTHASFSYGINQVR